MQSYLHNSILLLVFCAVFTAPFNTATAEESFITGTFEQTTTFRWNNENWFTMPHPKIAEFTIKNDGSAYGMTETGVPFTQENIENALGLRIQRFVMEDHHHYIIDGVPVYSLEEFSIQLARGNANQQSV